MKSTARIGGTVRAACVSVAMLGGCAAGANSGLPAAAPPAAHAALRMPMQATGSHCRAFAPDFDQYVACQRADGTLRSFDNPQIVWRVRYFVRFSAMPCREAPTVEEAYVFQTVVNDLSVDPDLNDQQRAAVRTAMFEGTVHCP